VIVYDKADSRLNFLRKLAACLSVLAVLCAALAPASAGLLWAIVLPALLLVGVVAVVSTDPRPEDTQVPLFQLSAVLGSRAPPSL